MRRASRYNDIKISLIVYQCHGENIPGARGGEIVH